MARDFIDKKLFALLSSTYGERFGVSLCAADAHGALALGKWGCHGPEEEVCRATRQMAIESTSRWGECTVVPCHGLTLAWAVPIMRNTQVLGGLIASAPERQVFPGDSSHSAMNLREACTELRLLAEAHNLTNAAALELQRQRYVIEQERAEAIREFKESPYDDILEMYLRKEGELIAAIRRDDRGEARKIINNLLVAMLHRSGESLNLTKTFFLQLIVAMCRAAVEAGGKPEELLGTNFQSLQDLSEIDSDEQLAPWLHRILDHVMDAIRDAPGRAAATPLSGALAFMEHNFHRDISREEISRAAHLSPSHLSHLFKAHVGQGLRERLNHLRVARAAELLVRTENPLSQIALDCGFKEQSYFTKVFRRQMGFTPKAYRMRNAKARST